MSHCHVGHFKLLVCDSMLPSESMGQRELGGSAGTLTSTDLIHGLTERSQVLAAKCDTRPHDVSFVRTSVQSTSPSQGSCVTRHFNISKHPKGIHVYTLLQGAV